MRLPFDKPKNFGPFELLAQVGRGATATVYKAREKSTGKIVALKMGARLLALDQSNFARFKREFTIIRHLSHPNLVEALEFGEEKQVPYLVLEFIEGQTLEKRLRDKGPMSLAEAMPVTLQIAAGLRFLHQNRILHRDVKPGNVLLTEAGHVKLGDFGLLKTLATESGITGNRQAMGTLEFGAPEQFEDAKNADFRSDVYSVAATFYAAITGLFPFGCGSLRRIMQRKLANRFVPLHKVVPSLPAELDNLIANSMHANRAQRPNTIDEFVDRLTKIVNSPDCEALAAAPAAAPNLDPPVSDGPERRSEVRVSVEMPAAYVPFHQNKRSALKATIVDVSSGGLCLQMDTPAPMQSIVEVTAADSGATYIAQVRWVRPIAEREFLVGCSFAYTLGPKDLVAITPTIH